MRPARSLWIVSVLVVAACGGDQGSADSTPVTTVEPEPAATEPAPTTITELSTTTTVEATTTTAQPESSVSLAVAEGFVDAFYSYDPDSLRSAMGSAESSQPFIVFYQGWAQGANYQIVERQPCVETGIATAACSVTVEDDLAKTLKIGFDVTDTFNLTFDNSEIVAVDTSSDDPPLSQDAIVWVFENKPELFEAGSACEGIFEGGPTPGDCAAEFVVAYQEFYDSGPLPTLHGYIAAYNARDIAGVMTFFAEDSLLTGHPFAASSTGLEEIRDVQLDDINSSSNEVDAYNISNVSVSGNTVTWDHVWVSDSGDRFCQFGHEAVAENGKFTSWAWPTGGGDCP